jgi:hypothetical protein
MDGMEPILTISPIDEQIMGALLYENYMDNEKEKLKLLEELSNADVSNETSLKAEARRLAEDELEEDDVEEEEDEFLDDEYVDDDDYEDEEEDEADEIWEDDDDFEDDDLDDEEEDEE